MRIEWKYLVIHVNEEAFSHISLCYCSLLNFFIYEENFLFFFYQCGDEVCVCLFAITFWPKSIFTVLWKFSIHFVNCLRAKFFSCEAYLQTRRMRLPSSRWRSAPPSSSAHGSSTSTLTRWLVVIEPIVTCKQKITMESVVKLWKKHLDNCSFLFMLFYTFSFHK